MSEKKDNAQDFTIEPVVGEIKMIAWPSKRPPIGYLFCRGQIESTQKYPELYAKIGNTFGGDEMSGSFALPDLGGRVPIGAGVKKLGAKVGHEKHQLTLNEMPNHSHHFYLGNYSAAYPTPLGDKNMISAECRKFGDYNAANVEMKEKIVFLQGDKAHNNMQPYLTIQYIIAWRGIY